MRLVDQHIAAAARIDRCLYRIRVARDDDAAIRCVEAIAVALHGMLRCEGRHRDVRVLVDDTCGDLVGVRSVAIREPPLVAVLVGTRLDVDAICREQMLRHVLETLGTVDFQRHAASDGPGRKDQVGVADGVIGVKMRHEYDAQARRLERLDVARECGSFGPTYDAGADIHEICSVVDHHRGGRPGTVGVDGGSSGTQHDDFCLARRRGGWRCLRWSLRHGQRGAEEE